MKEIKIYARAGQGAITTASILGFAYFIEGKYPYAFPHFGAARMGAPMNAFVRVDDKPVRLRCQIYEPDYILIMDATLMRGFNCFKGIHDKGIAIINGKEDFKLSDNKIKQQIYAVPANDIAISTIGRPLGNTAMLGAFVAATGEIKLESLIGAVKHRFFGKSVEQNILAVTKGYEYIKKSSLSL
ncbi:MAG: 2-oxoacid:acceptor oxidoreductase family protein [Candidatus Omnitrophica bacterium]|nr:2-oxoacid:acceptor oxidoreductase family protein [Candidatus Omnitrophota bacterium]